MKNSFLIIFVIISFIACKEKREIDFPVLVTSDFDTIVKVNSQDMLKSNSIVYGVNILDTLIINHNKKFDKSNFIPFRDNKIKYDSLIVYVDSDNLDFHTDEINVFDFLPPPIPLETDSVNSNYPEISGYNSYLNNFEKDKEERRKIHFSTLPVYIYNSSNSNRAVYTSIINGEGIYKILEAKDKNGKWRPIEYNNVPIRVCATDWQNYLLKPKHFIVSSVYSYSGDFKTDLRVKVMSHDKVFYSNIFEGEINYAQFDTVNEVKKLIKAFEPAKIESYEYRRKLIFLDFL